MDSIFSDESGLTVVDETPVNEPISTGQVLEVVEKNNGGSDLTTASQEARKSSLITIDEAKQSIDAEILSVLAGKFNGKLSDVRPVDEKDILF